MAVGAPERRYTKVAPRTASIVWIVLGEWTHARHVVKSIDQARKWNVDTPFYVLLPDELFHEATIELAAFNVQLVDINAFKEELLLRSFEESFFISGQMGGGKNHADFNVLTSARLFFLHAWMRATDQQDVIHLENDNLIYFDADDWVRNISSCDARVALTCRQMTEEHRFLVAGIVYIREPLSLTSVLTSIIEILRQGQDEVLRTLGTEWVNDMSLMGYLYWNTTRRVGKRRVSAPSSLTILPEGGDRGLGLADPPGYNDPVRECVWAKSNMIFDNAALGIWFFGDFHDPVPQHNMNAWGAYERIPARSEIPLLWYDDKGKTFPSWNDLRVASLHIHSKLLERATTVETSQGFVRSSSFPYITGDGFRALCSKRCEDGDWREGHCNFHPDEVEAGECIFIPTTDLKSAFRTTNAFLWAFDKIRTRIRQPYVIVTHNGDRSLPDGDSWHEKEDDDKVWSTSFSHWLDDVLLMHWFTVNCYWVGAKSSKLTCIPLGLENAYVGNGGRRPTNTSQVLSIGQLITHGGRRHPSALVAFARDGIKPDRGSAIDALNGKPYIHSVNATDYEHWVTLVRSHDYVICPYGHGFDSHRVWEVLLLGSIPVVKSSTIDELYLTLPVRR